MVGITRRLLIIVPITVIRVLTRSAHWSLIVVSILLSSIIVSVLVAVVVSILGIAHWLHMVVHHVVLLTMSILPLIRSAS